MYRTRMNIFCITLCVAALSAACEGKMGLFADDIVEPTSHGTETPPDAPDDPDDPTGPVDIDQCADQPSAPVADVPTRILTSQELNNALAALFPTLDLDRVQMIDDGRVGSFVLNSRETVPTSHVRDFRLMAEDVADEVAQNIDRVAPCDTSDQALLVMCAEDEVEALAERAFRRPLEQTERDGLMTLYETGRAEGGHAEGIRYVVEALLQAPSFIYVVEESGTPGSVRNLDGHEIAQRMASLLWRSLPDDELRRAAAAGELADPAKREAQARRMLDDPRGEAMMRSLVMQWLGIDRLDRKAFAQQEENAALVEAMSDETRRLIDHVVTTRDARWSELLTSRYSFVDQTLADHYGISLEDAEQVTDGVWRVETPERAGILTHASFLSLEHGPVHRGLSIRKAILCGNVPGPNGIDTDAIATEAGESERSKSSKRLAHDTCGGCHAMMDPLGLAFETFDDLGIARSMDQHGNPVSDDGEVFGTQDSDGPFTGATELADRLAESGQVRECVSKNLFLWAYARQPSSADACAIAGIEEALVQNDDNLKEALVSIVAEGTFGERLTSKGEP